MPLNNIQADRKWRANHTHNCNTKGGLGHWSSTSMNSVPMYAVQLIYGDNSTLIMLESTIACIVLNSILISFSVHGQIGLAYLGSDPLNCMCVKVLFMI